MTARYVVGLVFDPDFNSVLLCRKNTPEWQKGLWNGIGGKVEEGETYLQAMARECKEESGLIVTDWRLIADLGVYVAPNFEVRQMAARIMFFRGTSSSVFHREVPTVNDVGEELDCFHMEAICHLKTIPNLQYLIPLAKHFESPDKLVKLSREIVLTEIVRAGSKG